MATARSQVIHRLLWLSHELGREGRALAILGEGNTSARLGRETFLIKASGSNLGTLTRDGLTECRFDTLLGLLAPRRLSDRQIDDALLASRVDARSLKPSTEAVFHAWLLTMPDVDFVGHTHATTVNQLLCSKWARTFARRRLFPDEIVCCGEASVFVPYTDPGPPLARVVRREVKSFVARGGQVPRVILIENHGLIAMGGTADGVLATTLMVEKAARIFVGAAAAAGTPRFLTPAQVARIAARPDEHYRRKVLKL